jgi:hypothetical protein
MAGLRMGVIGGLSMTATFVSMIAVFAALLGAFGTAIVLTGALIAWQDWQRQKASANCAAGHRLDGAHPRVKPRF